MRVNLSQEPLPKDAPIGFSQRFAHILDLPDNCSRCGFCLDVCPVYREILTETAAPRGKIQLSRQILSGRIDLSENMRTILSKCLLCGSCSAACPGGLKGSHLFSGMRWMAMQETGIKWRKKMLYRILSRKWMLSASAGFAAWADKHFGRMIRKQPAMPGLAAAVPRFNPKSFSDSVPEVSVPSRPTRTRVLYFHGCATNYLSEEIGWAALRVLSAMGVEVITPKDQGCCGLPILASGARHLALENIRKLVNSFSGDKETRVIVDCATCGSALRQEFVPILEEFERFGLNPGKHLIRSAARLADRTQDIMEFISGHPDWLPSPGAASDRIIVTYHDPCHLNKGQGVKQQVRQVFAVLPNIALREMKEADACCGGGGVFQVDHPELSGAVTARKVENILASEAPVLATGCPGCRITLQAGLPAASGIRVVHPIQILDRALKG